MRRGVLVGLLIALGLGLFVGVFLLAGPGAVWAQVKSLGPWGFAAMLAGDLTAAALWMTSWGILLRSQGIRTPWSGIAGAALSGFAISYITPVAYVGGEPVRAWLISRSAGRPLTAVYATILVDRLLAGLSLVTFAVLGGMLALTGRLIPTPTKIKVAIGLTIVATAVGLGVLSFARNFHWLSRILEFAGRRHPGWRWLNAAAAVTHETENDIHAAFSRHLPRTLLALLLQLMSFLCSYLRPLLFFHFTRGVWFSVRELAVYFNLNAILTTILWLTPAGVGTAEGGRVGILHLVGIAPDGGVAFSLTIRSMELLLVAAGLTYLVQRGLGQLVRTRKTDDLGA